MKFFALVWRGIRDVYDQFIYFVLLSFAYFFCCLPAIVGVLLYELHPLLLPVTFFTMILIPPATLTLFALADPRRAIQRPEWKEILNLFGSEFKRAIKIGIVTFPVLIILGWNIIFFFGMDVWMAAFVPLWIVMLVFLTVLTMYMFSLAGTMESGVKNAFRGGMFTLVSYPFRSAGLGIFAMLFIIFGSLSVLPMLTIGPPLLAAITNRFVFDALQVYVMDPNKPTNEREWERERGINLEKSIWDRIKIRGGRN